MALAGACCCARHKRFAGRLLRRPAHLSTTDSGACWRGRWWPWTGITFKRVAGTFFSQGKAWSLSLSGGLRICVVYWLLEARGGLHRSQLPLAGLWRGRSWVYHG